MKGKVGGQWNKIFMEVFRSMSNIYSTSMHVHLSEYANYNSLNM